ncbi:hypothetical protein [Burkholderia phage FLC9]|nr:hypothetical protein [Burkholderia phage FLC9]
MSAAVTAATTIVLMSATQNHISTGSHIGPVLWQGIMMILMIPFGGLALWAYTKEPFHAYDEKTTKLKKRCRIIWRVCLWSYLVIGVILFIVIFRSGV